MKLYCPKCNGERISFSEQDEERVSIDKIFSIRKVKKKKIFEAKCLDCGYMKRFKEIQ